MGIFFWKNNKQIDEFSDSIANEFYNAVTPMAFEKYLVDTKKAKGNKKRDKNVKRAVQVVITRIKNFRQQVPLGVYGKARMHMKFKNRLLELGYGSEIVDDLSKLIMLETP